MSEIAGVDVTFLGNWSEEIPPAKVKLAGVQRSERVAEIMRESDAMIHAAWGEPCANVIVEAMACGLPVIYRDSGGNRELTGDCGIPLEDDLQSVIDRLKANYDDLRQTVMDQQPRFRVSSIATEYVSYFEHAISECPVRDL